MYYLEASYEKDGKIVEIQHQTDHPLFHELSEAKAKALTLCKWLLSTGADKTTTVSIYSTEEKEPVWDTGAQQGVLAYAESLGW